MRYRKLNWNLYENKESIYEFHKMLQEILEQKIIKIQRLYRQYRQKKLNLLTNS
jgi:hypothetical protein